MIGEWLRLGVCNFEVYLCRCRGIDGSEARANISYGGRGVGCRLLVWFSNRGWEADGEVVTVSMFYDTVASVISEITADHFNEVPFLSVEPKKVEEV